MGAEFGELLTGAFGPLLEEQVRGLDVAMNEGRFVCLEMRERSDQM